MMYELDASATRAVNALSGKTPILDHLMIWVSVWGVPLMILAVALQWWPRLDREGERHIIVTAGLAFIVGLMLNQLILLFIHRQRPYDVGITNLLISSSADPSFPSDHATAAFAIATSFLWHRNIPQGAALLVFASAIALSRVYIGTHYVSDVIGGAATGSAAAVLMRALYPQGTRLDRWVCRLL
jgi:undecaprenyl-diphosphatase